MPTTTERLHPTCEKEQRKQGFVIGVDLDGVVADFVRPFLRFYNHECNTKLEYKHITSYEFSESFDISKEEANRIVYNFQLTQEFANLQPLPGTESALRLLSKRHTLHVITSRVPEVEQTTLAWLTFRLPGKFTGIHFSHNAYATTGKAKTKLDICKDLGVHVLIEDSLEYALQCSEGNLRIALFDQPWNQSSNLPQNVTRVKSWQEVVRLIEDEISTI